MNNLLRKIIIPGWAVWFGYLVYRLLLEGRWGPEEAIADHGTPHAMSLDCPLMVAIAIIAGWRLYQKPRRSMAIVFVVFCAILVWKFWIGCVVMWTSPSLGGFTPRQAPTQWWVHSTASTRLALASLVPPLLVIFTAVYWPRYCMRRAVGASAGAEGKVEKE